MVLIRYYYHSYGAQFLCWRLSLGEDGKRVAKCAKRKFYSVFSTLFLMYFSCCLLLVMGACWLFLILKLFW